MHVALIGAGALGLVYALRLAVRTKTEVTFVVRPKRVGSTDPFVIESAWNGKRETLDSPVRTTEVPHDADVILLAVGTDDLDALPLGESTAPIVVLTPMMPQDWRRVRDALGDRVLAAMPTLASYVRKDDGVVRYWLLPAPTLIDEPRPALPVIDSLVTALGEAGVPAKLQLGVHERNPATTVAYIAAAMALAIAGGVDELVADESLCEVVSEACREGGRLAHRIGSPDPVAFVFPLLTSKWGLRVALRALPAEARFFAEDHFGRKIAAQHLGMIRQMIELAEEKGLPHSAFDEIERRLVSSSHGTS